MAKRKAREDFKCVVCGVHPVTKEGGKCWPCVIRQMYNEDDQPKQGGRKK